MIRREIPNAVVSTVQTFFGKQPQLTFVEKRRAKANFAVEMSRFVGLVHRDHGVQHGARARHQIGEDKLVPRRARFSQKVQRLGTPAQFLEGNIDSCVDR